MKHSKSDLINFKYNLIRKEKYSAKKIFQIRLSIIECIRSIWKMSGKRTPIIFRKVYPLSIRHKSPIITTTNFDISTNKQINNRITDNLTKQISTYSFHTARESLSNLSVNIIRKVVIYN